uniref:Ovule protein n=1 Tax=Panagrolaimus sp. PS1159 TaxID=55785 RepID=A0AC35FHD8_9BILA
MQSYLSHLQFLYQYCNINSFTIFLKRFISTTKSLEFCYRSRDRRISPLKLKHHNTEIKKINRQFAYTRNCK